MFINSKPFPTCLIKSKTDKGFVSQEQFICIVADAKFPEQLEIKLLYPYWEQNENEQTGNLEDFYSWSDQWGNIFSHFEKGHEESLAVIDWFSVDEKNQTVDVLNKYFKKAKDFSTS